MLKLINLTKKFGEFTAVDNLNLEVKKGDLYGFLGPNGAGKTTTIKMIAGLYNPTSGSMMIDDIDNQKDSLKTKEIFAYIPDTPFLYDKLTGKEFLYFCGGLYSIPKKLLKNKIDSLVDLLKIGDWLNKRTEEYSRGMQQRITIASAFLHDPKLLIVDEPMVGLDPQSAFIVKQVFKNKVQEGLAIFMSTHSLDVVEDICNKAAIINKGKLIFDDNITKLQEMKILRNNKMEELFIELTAF
jgi:ABC-2 type transport system ATP-binding protein